MEFTLEIFLVAFILLVALAFYYEHPKAEIPREVDQHRKLYILHYIVNFIFGLGRIFEKLGICKEVYFIRTLLHGIPPWNDANLFIKDLKFAKVSVRVYHPKVPSAGQRRGVLYLHGGIGQIGSIGMYERVCRFIARRSDSVVVCVGYRLAPEHPYPTQFWDCLTATVHFMTTAEDYGVDPTRIIICGDSSGGTLAAAVCQTLVGRTDLPKARAQIILYPFLQAVDFNLPSYQQNGSVPLLLKKRTLTLGMQYLNKDVSLMKGILEGSHVPEDLKLKFSKWLSPDNIPMEFKIRGYKPPASATYSKELHTLAKPVFETTFSPLLAEDAIVRQLPETFILTCEYDVVRDDGLLYKKRLEDNGIPVTWYHIEDGFHGVLFLIDCGYISFPCGKRAMLNVVNFIKGL
ncbi:arylacetamide deacetylase-like 4 [Gopherus flavomarginatus]|uniref:arylacetamide deacetylase-like 4 n=1 Tax=Gopherus flavomarginatus TaxID=286002 RepID=UPI0021CBADED|nr:arylacetamide deacetylase-like 4 [Gopherus flavomarginatus]